MTNTSFGTLPLIDNLTETLARKLGSISVAANGLTLNLPLSSVDVHTQLVDRVATVTMRQSFTNPYSDFLEAVYIFPLSGGIAVNHFEMRVGERKLVGAIEERKEARRQYEEARKEGKRTALLEQERDDVFTVQLGNLPPGETVEITLSYAERLPYFADGMTELRLPTVVAPRYIPGSPTETVDVGHGVETDTDLVPDASRISPPRLLNSSAANVRLSITVELAIDSSATIADLRCSQHATSTSIKPGWLSISLANSNEVLNRDFVLTWRLADSEEVRTRLLVHAKPDESMESYAMVSITPPRYDGFQGCPRDVVFVLDRSGSMSGIKMSSAIRACSILLETLSPDDRYCIQAFDDRYEWMGKPHSFYRADEEGLNRGHTFLRTITARGGTELDGAIAEALTAVSSRDKAQNRMSVIVVITDGQIGNESYVLKRIQTQLGDSRVFTVGIDTSVNSGFLKRLASVGGGTCALVQPGTQLESALIQVGREINVPLVTDLSVHMLDPKHTVRAIAPYPIPDLFQGRGVTLFFRTASPDSFSIEVRGQHANGTNYCQKVESVSVNNEAIPQLWAKACIMQLEDRFRATANESDSETQAARDKIKQEIIELSKRHKLLSKLTAFILVDHSEIANPSGTHKTVVQPVAQPEQWEEKSMQMQSQQLSQMLCCSAPPPPPVQASPTAAPASYEANWNIAGSAGPAPAPASGSAKSQSLDQLFSHASEGLSNIIGRLSKKAVSKSEQMQERHSEAREDDRQRRMKNGGSDPATEALTLSRFYSQLASAVERVLAEIDQDQGTKLETGTLATIREAILQCLNSSTIASRFPKLQRFLRVEVLELVALISSGRASKADLRRIRHRCQPAFEAVQKEFEANMKHASANANFWEATV